MALIAVALGGALGASARYLCVSAVAAPYGTVLVNVLGSVVIGVAFVWLAARGLTDWQPFLVTGVLGGFTTFSAFSLDAFKLFEAGQTVGAVIYVASTVALCLAAVALGVWLAQGVLR